MHKKWHIWFRTVLVLMAMAAAVGTSPAQTGGTAGQPSDDPMVDTDDTSTGETITFAFLDELPNHRTYFDAVSLVAGVAGGLHPNDRNANVNIYVHGADNSDNIYLVDGMETTNNATGMFGTYLSYQAIEEVEVKTGGFEAEYGRATGGVINVVTRSGGNEFHGAVPIYYTNLDLEFSEDDRGQGTFEREDYRELEPGLSVGGPIVSDRLWFFASYNRFERRIEGMRPEAEYPYDEVPYTRTEKWEEWLGKLTWQANDSNKLVGLYTADPSVLDSRDEENITIAPSAYSQLESGGKMYQLAWTGIFSKDAFLELRAAHHETDITVGPANAGQGDWRFIDYLDGMGMTAYTVYGNVANITDISHPRDQYQAVFNLFREGGGEHSLKFGAEYQDFSYEELGFAPDTFYINHPTQPDRWYWDEGIDARVDGEILTLFAQDTWSINDRWTLNLGFRWERQSQDYDTNTSEPGEVYDFGSLLAPRLGVSWDVRGDGRSKAFFTFGRYYDAIGTALGRALARGQGETRYWEWAAPYDWDGEPWQGYGEWPPADGEWDPNDPPAGFPWTYMGGSDPEVNPTQVDPGLDPNFKEEITAGYEVELFTDNALGVRFIYNWQDNLIEDIVGNEMEIREGIDNTHWYYITNVSGAERSYQGLELSWKKRLSNNYQYLFVYTYSRAKGSVVNTAYAEGLSLYADFNQVAYNRYGYLPWDDRHYLKLNGSYHLPWGFVVGTSFGWRSGRPYNKIGPISSYTDEGNPPGVPPTDYFNFYGYEYYVDPRGSHRMDSVWWLDLRLTKDFAIGSTELSIILDAFNVFNRQSVVARNETWYGEGDRNWGAPLDWQDPGYISLGARYTF